ncbi:MAG: CapA family protein, partial [Microbacterium sp.]
RFAAGAAAGVRYDVDPRDRADLVRSVRTAAQTADLVVVAAHAHESTSGAGNDRRPPRFLVDLFHEAVEHGANLGVVTGPHVLRGAEIHCGTPILYGLGSLFLELGSGLGVEPDLARALGSDWAELTPSEQMTRLLPLPGHWFDSAVARASFRDAMCEELRLHPIELTRNASTRVQGWPSPASPEGTERILQQFRDDCAVLEQSVALEEGTAVLRP